VTAALLCGYQVALRAHDPGLSALDVRVARDRIRVSLSLAPGDAQQPAVGAIERFAREAIVVTLDGVSLVPRDADTAHSHSGVAVTLEFERAPGDRLGVRSDVPRLLANGHRELLTVTGPDGRAVLERLLDARMGEAGVELGTLADRRGAAADFFVLGLRHILGGYDHLLFLAALLIGVRRLRSVVTTVTAFTIAHSVTLSLAVLGFVAAPAAIVEPLIAASIVFVGIENLVRDPVASRWKVTFAFGLVHGFGFAGALRDLGIGGDAGGVALPLGCFNLGVEAGQIAVVAALWPVISALDARPGWRFRFAQATSLAVAVAGVYWLVERTT
jgi:hydrogenase/urease accessory protein HupE